MQTTAVSMNGPKKSGNRRPALPYVDCDLHHSYRENSDIYPYLSKVFVDRAKQFGLPGRGAQEAPYLSNGGFGGARSDLVDHDNPQYAGGVVDADATRVEYLDKYGAGIAILTGAPMYSASSVTDVDYASAGCRAFNEFTVEHWLTTDERFRYSMAICTQDPAGAVEEIDRIGDHPQIVSILMPCGAPRPFGNRFYHPIYEACERHGLAVQLHFGSEGQGVNPPPTAAGWPSYYAESRVARPPFYQVHLASFIFEGVFEKFPALKVVVIEGSFGWVPAFRWRMDESWKALRYQTPWVRRLPSEYLVEHVRIATQPCVNPDFPDALLKTIEWMEGDRTLVYASDYPHWDWDTPEEVLIEAPDDLRARVFVENAHETFNLGIPVPAV